MKRKIAIVNQRYGLEVNGGAELYTRLIAEKLNRYYDIEVLTSCALDYTNWDNHYPQGISYVNGIKVRRFTVEKQRDTKKFTEIYYKMLAGNDLNEEWINEQGPYCPGVIDFIKDEKDNYDVFIFVTYLYYLTVKGIASVKEKAILIPTAHDEAYIKFDIYRDVFTCPKAIIYNTDEERELVCNHFNNQNIKGDTVGIGIDIPDKINASKFKKAYRVKDYLLYVGRIDIGKNCPELFTFFIEYKKKNKSNLKLVLMGQEIIQVPDHPDILSLGFVSDEDKINGMAGAKLLVMPSYHESLSMVVLESMALGVPVVVHGKCDVLTGHCKKSNAGLYYTDYNEFEGCINYLIKHGDVYDQMNKSAKEYIERNYRWDVIITKFKNLIDYAGENN